MADGHRILVVDDDDAMRTFCGHLLSEWGYEWVGAATCAEARSVFGAGQFSCSLVDLGLPDGNGMDLLAEFSRSDPLLVNVVFSGDHSADSVIRGMRKGAFDYLTKPVQADLLKPVILRALTHHDAVRQRAALTQLLLDEREQLKLRIEQATRDIRQYADTCEASNHRLQALVRLSQMSSSGLDTEADVFEGTFQEVRKFLPLKCLALQDGVGGEFLAAYVSETGELAVVAAEGDAAETGGNGSPTPADTEALVTSSIARHTELNMGSLETLAYPHVLGNRPSCTVGMLFEAGFEADGNESEFLGMCAHHVAAEWQMARLLQHAAQQASIGSIALEVSRSLIQSLTAIQISSDVLNEMVDSPEAADGLAIIPNNVSMMRGLIREFRNLSRRGKDSIETVRLDQLIERALSVLSVAIQNRGVQIVKEFETEGQCVLLNGAALARTFLDLISSAIRSVGNGERISLRLCDLGRDHIRFEIALDDVQWDSFRGGGSQEDAQSLRSLANGHPSFLLAQRTVYTCAGKLVIKGEEGGGSTLGIVLPKDATQASLAHKEAE